MKKIKFVAMILLACSIFFVGCSKSENLKLSQTDLSIANFYQGGNASEISINASENLNQEQMGMAVAMGVMMLPLSLSKTFEVCLVSAMDYCLEIVDGGASTMERFFEYSDAIVLVTKAKNQSNFTTKYYGVMGEYGIADVLKGEPAYTYNIKITPNKRTGVYEFSENTTKNSGSVQYNKQFGILKIKYTYKLETNVQCVYERNFYKYAGQAYALREIVEVSDGTETEVLIREALFKAFYTRIKAGIVKDINALVDLTDVAEDDVAKESLEGDICGFIVTIEATPVAGDASEAFVPNFNISKYGIFPEEAGV